MAFTVPDETDFKEYFVRDFPYGTDLSQVVDADITNALGDTAFNFNEALFGTQAEFTLAYLLLTAHFLVTNLQASAQGISGQYNWLQASKSVGSVSESFSIPQRILDNPELAMYSKTRYGAKFLMLLLPRLVGQMFTVRGRTKP